MTSVVIFQHAAGFRFGSFHTSEPYHFRHERNDPSAAAFFEAIWQYEHMEIVAAKAAREGDLRGFSAAQTAKRRLAAEAESFGIEGTSYVLACLHRKAWSAA